MRKVVVSINSVSKKIGSKEIVKNLSFHVNEGEVYGFLGPNGSGKTTTIRMITGLISVTQGKIEICGYDITRDKEKALAHIGAIVENPELYEYMTGLQNLKHFANMASVPVKQERINEIVKLVDLEGSIGKKVKTYSLGMKQRLGIAQALLHKPKVLILDEPTNGLDPAGIRKLRDYLKGLAKEENIAVIVSSHLLSEMELMCDRVIIIKDGTFIREQNLNAQIKDEVKVLFEVDQMEKAKELINGTVEIGGITVMTKKEEIPAIVKSLVNGGFNVYGVEIQNKTLEDEFLEITEEVQP
ncbi:ABC transporter ATP-binding protein [Bacillus cereus]|uniref:ABC transporter ATP-binding protein n=1 Tax=Bacillus cereus TaxID=1396 RepID=A0A164QTF1_BACCE|nr:ABC transporter ATP-binding protein [Bacillus cereus]KZD72160.1 ABC transporter ATP-binding protein [Bacillus cereus]